MRYFDQIKAKPTHERRAHAMQMAAAIVIAIFIVWVATLALRLATEDPAVAQSGDDTSSQLANIASGADDTSANATLIVASSSDSYAQ